MFVQTLPPPYMPETLYNNPFTSLTILFCIPTLFVGLHYGFIIDVPQTLITNAKSTTNFNKPLLHAISRPGTTSAFQYLYHPLTTRTLEWRGPSPQTLEKCVGRNRWRETLTILDHAGIRGLSTFYSENPFAVEAVANYELQCRHDQATLGGEGSVDAVACYEEAERLARRAYVCKDIVHYQLARLSFQDIEVHRARLNLAPGELLLYYTY